MPMPVSATEKAITERAASSRPCPGVQPDCAGAMASETRPSLVNLNALASRFFSTCLRRPMSVLTSGGSAESMKTENCKPLPCATCPKVRSRSSRSSSSRPRDIDGGEGARLDLRQVEQVVDQRDLV